MRLHEYQSKQQFQKFNIPVTLGDIVNSPEDAYSAALKYPGAVVLKAQVLTGERDKAQGILFADTPEEASRIASMMLKASIHGLPVRQILVEPKIDIAREIYLGITYDRIIGKPVLVASSEGGIDVETTARTKPEAVIREDIKPILGLRSYQIAKVAGAIELEREYWRPFQRLTHGLYACYTQSDALLAEINPLVVTTYGEILALDGKLIIDDNALYRQKDLAMIGNTESEHDAKSRANAAGMSYIKLNGTIGCIVNGAGLAMTTMDMIQLYSNGHTRPASFMDIGGGAKASQVTLALRIILTDPDVKCILLNIFGGLTRCDEVAQGILTAYEEVKPQLPVIVRLQGTNADAGFTILEEANLPNMMTAHTLAEAADMAIQAGKKVSIHDSHH